MHYLICISNSPTYAASFFAMKMSVCKRFIFLSLKWIKQSSRASELVYLKLNIYGVLLSNGGAFSEEILRCAYNPVPPSW